MNMIKTSIIVPVYNTSQYLWECFDSIFNQTQKDIEVIAINDGSTDNSLSILEKIKNKHPEMIIYSQENKGSGAARNKGVELATGEYIYFIDSDDCLTRNAIETCYSYAKTYNLDIVMFDAYIFGDLKYKEGSYDRTGIIREQEIAMSGKDFFVKYANKALFTSVCLIYTSAQFLKESNVRFTQGVYYEDDEFYYSLVPLAEQVMYIPKFLYGRRYREGSIITSDFDSRHAKDSLKLIQAIKRQKHDKNIADIMQKIECKELNILLNKCKECNLLTDQQFVKEFYLTAREIYGCDIEKINGYSNINVLYQLSNMCSDSSYEISKKIQDRKNEIMDQICKEIPLTLDDKYVGIYGTGVRTARFLDEYEKNIGEIKAKVIFIESSVTFGQKKYRKHDVFCVSDVGNMDMDCIVIASTKYMEEIYQTIYDNYGSRFRVIDLDSLGFY